MLADELDSGHHRHHVLITPLKHAASDVSGPGFELCVSGT
jgi:hypothetical protein